MIVPMAKVFVACRARDQTRAVDVLGDLGVMHLVPVDPAKAAPNEKTLGEIADIERAIRIVSAIAPAAPPPPLSPLDAAREVLAIRNQATDRHNRLAALDHRLRQIAIWGDVRLDRIKSLRAAGVDLRFCSVPTQDVAAMDAEVVQVFSELPGRRFLVGVASRDSEIRLPESAEEYPLPERDAPSIRQEAAELDAAGRQDALRLAHLACLADSMGQAVPEMRLRAEVDVAQRSALDRDLLSALQGWVPAKEASSLAGKLAQSGLDAAVQILEPEPEEHPPTLIRSPKWAEPIEGLFKMLGTVAGYREFDVSVPFMIALPLFSAMLIADAGYGTVLFLLPLVFRAKLKYLLGASMTHLLIVIGAAAIAWGLVISSFFGVELYSPLIRVDLSEESRTLMMRISFLIGAVHVSLAQWWQAARLFPDQRFLGKVGWGVFIWGILGVVQMFVLRSPFGWDTAYPYLLLAGGTLAVLFDNSHPNPLKRVLLGTANAPLAMLGTFSDVISYVRLMAVGLAGSVLAVSFNNLVGTLGFWPLVAVAWLAAHSLNLALCMIALFAHGVRLNVLEFSNNLGMQWTGYPYRPFTKSAVQED
ncbi:MAG TPA: hypothetical protein PKY77_14535 [Phycisphaerae bacterium]|nr:hypothetical protein [Phycisphaerae bacterium]HRY67472.1 hypothetical protein [Phycisphaerae bacterium]HSA27935.1 hypothetical protein [Phycisphaerae bacterium]